MAVFSTTPAQPATAGITGHIGHTFTALTQAAIAWNSARVTRKQLSSLTDRELDDIGLCRGDIGGIV